MEFLPEIIIAIVAFAAGIYAGKVLAPNFRRIKELQQDVEEAEQKHQAYKDNVAMHFSESADLFGDITQKYRSLYEHMSSGAYDLCDRRSIPRELAASHVNILAVETPEVSPQLTDHGAPIAAENTAEDNITPETVAETKSPDELIVDVTRSGLSPLDQESQQIAHDNQKQNKKDSENTAEIIDLDSQRNEDAHPTQQAKDYAVKAKGVINHNSLNRDDVST